jgi:arylsulfatase A-like enzyme
MSDLTMHTGGARPNILVIMADEHAPQFSGFGGHPLVRTPNLDRLAARGVLVRNAYCNSPLCVPSRMCFMTGRYPHHNGAYDNATALSSDAVTWAHLRREGLRAELLSRWDPIALERRVRQEQKERILIRAATHGERQPAAAAAAGGGAPAEAGQRSP